MDKVEEMKCACDPSGTTGWTEIKCCNICGLPIKDELWGFEKAAQQIRDEAIRECIVIAHNEGAHNVGNILRKLKTIQNGKGSGGENADKP